MFPTKSITVDLTQKFIDVLFCKNGKKSTKGYKYNEVFTPEELKLAEENNLIIVSESRIEYLTSIKNWKKIIEANLSFFNLLSKSFINLFS